MRNGTSTLLLIVVCIVLVLTNPAQSQHQDAIYEHTEKAMARLGQQVAGKPGKLIAGLASKLAIGALEYSEVELFEYHDYYIASVMILNGEIVSLGVLGRVIISSNYAPRDILEALLSAQPSKGAAQPASGSSNELSVILGQVLGALIGH